MTQQFATVLKEEKNFPFCGKREFKTWRSKCFLRHWISNRACYFFYPSHRINQHFFCERMHMTWHGKKFALRALFMRVHMATLWGVLKVSKSHWTAIESGLAEFVTLFNFGLTHILSLYLNPLKGVWNFWNSLCESCQEFQGSIDCLILSSFWTPNSR